jgi:hypothetical protein
MDSKNVLVRWTVGPVHDCGFDVLRESVRNMRRLYPEFDYVVCYNNLSTKQLEKVKRLDVEILDQSKVIEGDVPKPRVGYSVEWKLHPPRIRPESYELFLDNDILLHKREERIVSIGKTNNVLLYQGLHGLHGSYSEMVPKGIRINSGIFGVPPNFRFCEKIKSRAKPFKDYFDEQGLVASILIEQPHEIIPLTEVPIVERDWPLEAHDNNLEVFGYHFVGANKGEHPAFRKFVQRGMLI